MRWKLSFILGFDEVDKTDVELVGVRGAQLGDMAGAGIPLQKGFIVSSKAYFAFFKDNGLDKKIVGLLSTAHFERPDSLMQINAHIKKLIMQGRMSEELIKEIFFAYRKISGIFSDAMVEVYISPTSLITNEIASLRQLRAGFLAMTKKETDLILKIKEGWASLFSPRAIIYRYEKKLDHFRIGMAVIVKKMLKPQVSGTIFTSDPNDKTKIIIRAITNRYEVRKADLEIINRFISGKGGLSNSQIVELARLGKRFERHYYFPQEIEWAIEKNKIYIVKTKSYGIASPAKRGRNDINLRSSRKARLVLKGTGVSRGIGVGRVKIITNVKYVDKLERGDILVATHKNCDYIKVMKKVAAIVMIDNVQKLHKSIHVQKLKIPAVALAKSDINGLKDGLIVTVNATTGRIYR